MLIVGGTTPLVKAKIIQVDDRRGTVTVGLTMLTNGTEYDVGNFHMSFADACRFSGTLLNRADKAARSRWANEDWYRASRLDIKRLILARGVEHDQLTRGQASRLYREAAKAGFAADAAND